MTTLLIIVHILVSLFLIAIVLLQHGKGADIGATFGGSGQSVFGSEGPVPLLNKITTFSAIVFMGTSVSLAYISAHESTGSIMTEIPAQETAPVEKEAPVTIPMPGTEVQLDQPAQEAPSPAEQEVTQEPVAEEEDQLYQTIQDTLVEEEPVAEVQETVPAPEEQTAEQAAPVEQETIAEPAQEKAE
uniref:preprotein translocase subunit SecG n=1 Tax=Candidatus Electrothrix sp. TaxID=2170559 RepID=UPI004055FB2A